MISDSVGPLSIIVETLHQCYLDNGRAGLFEMQKCLFGEHSIHYQEFSWQQADAVFARAADFGMHFDTWWPQIEYFATIGSVPSQPDGVQG